MKTTSLSHLIIGCAAMASLHGCSSSPPRNYVTPMPVSVPMDSFSAGESVSDRIGKHDLLEVAVFKVPDLSKTVRVDSRGNITLPLVGSIRAAGQTTATLEQAIASRLAKDYIHDPQVSVFVKESANNRVTVAGSVKQAGVFPVTGDVTLLQAISMAGGMDKLADGGKVYLFRQNGNRVQRYRVNMDAISQGYAPDPMLMPNDRVVVLDSQGKVLLDNLKGMIAPVSVF